MRVKMTKAMFSIKPTFVEMISAHTEEIRNHQKLIDKFKERAKRTNDYEERMVCYIEAHRNKEHQKGHIKVVEIYKYLKETL